MIENSKNEDIAAEEKKWKPNINNLENKERIVLKLEEI